MAHNIACCCTQVLHHAELNLPDSEGFDGTLSVAYGAELPLADNKRPRGAKRHTTWNTDVSVAAGRPHAFGRAAALTHQPER